MNSINLSVYLDKLESLIDLRHVEATRELQRRAFAFEPVDHVPTVINYGLAAGEWPGYGFKDIFEDPEKMLLTELGQVYMGAKLKDDRCYGIRANYGCGIIASMFGCPVHTFEHALPIGKEVSREQLERVLAGGLPDVRSGQVGRAFDTVAFFREKLRPYPKLSAAVGSQMLDIQGPFDNASIIWGSAVYLAFYEEPERLRRSMDLVTDAILAVVREHRRVDGLPLIEHGGPHNYLGGVCVRNDSSVNLGHEHYVEFVKPFDRRLLGQWGGSVHFCGKAHQWWKEMLDIRGLKGINPYQGEFYDLYEMYEACQAAGVAIFQWMAPVDARCRERIRTGFSRVVGAENYDAACRLRDHLHATGHADSL